MNKYNIATKLELSDRHHILTRSNPPIGYAFGAHHEQRTRRAAAGRLKNLAGRLMIVPTSRGTNQTIWKSLTFRTVFAVTVANCVMPPAPLALLS